MGDNVLMKEQGTTKVSGDFNASSEFIQKVKIQFGADDSFTDVEAAAGLPVEVTTLPALAAGTNNIGDVDVLSLPPLAAGSNNIGDVDVLSLPALPTGTNAIGEVDVSQIRVEKTTIPLVQAASAYAAGDVVGGKISLSSSVRASGGSGVIESIIITSKSSAAPGLKAIIFREDPSSSTFTENAAIAISDGDLIKILDVVDLAGLGGTYDFADNSIIKATGLNIPIKLNGTSTLYLVLIATGAITFDGTTDLTVKVIVRQD